MLTLIAAWVVAIVVIPALIGLAVGLIVGAVATRSRHSTLQAARSGALIGATAVPLIAGWIVLALPEGIAARVFPRTSVRILNALTRRYTDLWRAAYRRLGVHVHVRAPRDG